MQHAIGILRRSSLRSSSRSVEALSIAKATPGLHQHGVRSFAKAATPAVVTIEEAKAMPREFREYPNDVLLAMAVHGDCGACTERMIREIMSVHDVSWSDAQPHLKVIQYESRRLFYLTKFPYRFGIAAAAVAGASTFPLCFHLKSVEWFNTKFVTAEVPEAHEVETFLEVGSWAWNWMEPPLGQLSFVILCAQFARSQMQNIGIKPYTDWWMEQRARRLHKRFPEYNASVLADFAQADWKN